jgi:uncharacterized protein
VIPRLLSRRYRDTARPFSVVADDGVRLMGTRVGARGAALVLCHGFLGWHRKAPVVRFVERMAEWFTVYAFDLRGHGRSGGTCTYGDEEFRDVDAVARLARSEADRVATFGASMGGIAVLRQAALLDDVDAVMIVSTPARWRGHRSAQVRRIQAMSVSRGGRGLVRGLGVRVTDRWNWPEDPEELVGKIAPTPLIIAHGRDDHFFDVENAWRLYARAEQPKRLLLGAPYGHAEDGFTPGFAELAARRLAHAMGLSWPPPL